MKFLAGLLSRAGLAKSANQLVAPVLVLFLLIGTLIFQFTKIFGFALAGIALVALFGLETLRVMGNKRQQAFEAAWPAVFDSMAQASASGIGTEAQLERISTSGPLALRGAFTKLVTALQGGQSLERALGSFQAKLSNRSADLFALLVLISSGFGVTGQNQIWKELSVRTRQEQATLGLILAKQNWTIGTAKLALLAPWLIAALLMQQGQNRAAFESSTGSTILLTGLLLSLFAYFLVNQLGAIRQTPRVLYAP